MLGFWRRVQGLLGRMLFCAFVLTTLGIDRVTQGGQVLAEVAAESQLDPQRSLLRLIAILIGGSLSMMALGYRTRG